MTFISLKWSHKSGFYQRHLIKCLCLEGKLRDSIWPFIKVRKYSSSIFRAICLEAAEWWQTQRQESRQLCIDEVLWRGLRSRRQAFRPKYRSNKLINAIAFINQTVQLCYECQLGVVIVSPKYDISHRSQQSSSAAEWQCDLYAIQFEFVLWLAYWPLESYTFGRGALNGQRQMKTLN